MIRKATFEDAHAIAQVLTDSWRSTYHGIIEEEYLRNMNVGKSAEWLERVIASGQLSASVYADKNETITGFASAGLNREQNEYSGELYSIYLLKSQQGKGIGTLLFNVMVTQLIRSNITSMIVWVLKDNPSKNFYSKLGGRFVREKQIEIGNQKLIEEAYGWPDLSSVKRLS